jgi:ATP-binding cassette subfamily F protein 3
MICSSELQDTFEKVRSEKLKQMKREFEAQKAKSVGTRTAQTAPPVAHACPASWQSRRAWMLEAHCFSFLLCFLLLPVRRPPFSALFRRAHIQEFIDKFRYNAKRAALVQSRIKALARMDALIDVVEEHQTNFSFPEPDRIDGHILTATNVKFGYTYSKILLDKVTCSVDMDSRIGVLGANGVGKSTLINILTGKLQPIMGNVSRNTSARVAVFAQHHVDGLDLRRSAVDMMMSIFPGHTAETFRRHLGCFGITGQLATQPIRALSGGQKSRLAFSIVTWKKPHVIILDEPTNHLDLETIDALISAIQNYGGGLLFVSHDQNFLQSVGSEFWGVSNGSVKRFDSFKAAKNFSYAASQTV